MAFTWTERPDSRASTSNPISYTLRYTAAGSTDAAGVKSYALSNTAPVVATVQGFLYRQDLKIDWIGSNVAKIEVPYGPVKHEVGSYRFNYDGGGGTFHITYSRSTVNSYAASGTPPSFAQAIGVHGDDIDGVDIVIPALRFSVTFAHPMGFFSLAQAAAISRYQAHVNSTFFFGFAAGEILFESFSGADGSEADAEVTYNFVRSWNETGLTIGSITGIAKDGHDYLWVSYKDAVSQNRTVKQPEFAYVERVYPRANLAAILGFG